MVSNKHSINNLISLQRIVLPQNPSSHVPADWNIIKFKYSKNETFIRIRVQIARRLRNGANNGGIRDKWLSDVKTLLNKVCWKEPRIPLFHPSLYRFNPKLVGGEN